LLSLALLFFATAAMPATFPETIAPAPYVATYSVSYRGINAGLLHFELIAEEDGRYVYDSYAEPSALARFLVGDVAERSVMHIDDDGVRPLYWFMADGNLRFVWQEERVVGIVNGERVEWPTEPGLQDRLSIQIAVMTALLRGREPGTIPMVDDEEIKHYSYSRIGPEQISTRAGNFNAVLYQSARPGSSRLSRLWHAPELGYLPVRIEQLRRGKLETVLELVRMRET
jgi:hypothetical protein